jgi:hypothetical protein
VAEMKLAPKILQYTILYVVAKLTLPIIYIVNNKDLK